ncbi:MAG: M42 family metallopeptidase, partial [Halanaerobium sp.]|nr:M42 family metallopeptidase [Halanaerobium sp.]
GEVRNLIRDKVSRFVDEIYTDTMGNLIAHKKGNQAGPKVMVAAHMDEIGAMVTGITEEGLLKFRPFGVAPRVLPAKIVLVGKDKVKGVIGAPPIHLQKKDQDRPFELDDLYIDIGADKEEEAKKLVKIGDPVVFATKCEEIGDGKIKGKSFDDRAGCAVLIELLKLKWPLDLYGVFTVQEEVGARGAATAAYRIKPDLALVLEGTSASDVPDIKEHGYSTTLEQGPALTLMDRSVIPHQGLVRALEATAKGKDIPYQYRRATVGGTDAGKIHLTKEGIPSAVISIPCRYIHSPVSILAREDLVNTERLLKEFLSSLGEGGIKIEGIN